MLSSVFGVNGFLCSMGVFTLVGLVGLRQG